MILQMKSSSGFFGNGRCLCQIPPEFREKPVESLRFDMVPDRPVSVPLEEDRILRRELRVKRGSGGQAEPKTPEQNNEEHENEYDKQEF